ncbi:hypothetical protein AURDEDRAFT_113016 [Auricularia subglabra TFB-10046 SS5]|nr:hypothetical protein AURDEDRAFT_113016 [Auricularia subglabra TFB-10046 SS5]
MSDGARLRASWAASLSEAETAFRALSSSATTWQRVPSPKRENSVASPQSTTFNAVPELPDPVVHRRPSKRGDVYRVMVDVPLDDQDSVSGMLDAWKAILSTPELRKEWDPAVESARLIEMFDLETRIVKTNFMLGWPANPRDAITITRTVRNANTLIDIATSLPRSPDEPAYLRPAPPYVRSHIHLFAWCIQLPQSQSGSAADPADRPRRPSSNKIRISCFWQHDLKTTWALGALNLSQQLPAMLLGLLNTVRTRGRRLPIFSGFGTSVGVENITFDVGREALVLEYHIIPDEEDGPAQGSNIEVVQARKRLRRAVEVFLPAACDFSWDLQLTTQAPSSETAALPWKVQAIQASAAEAGRETGDYLVLSARHASVPAHHILKVKLAIELATGTGLRLNGVHHPVEDALAARDPTARPVDAAGESLLKDAQSMTGISIGSVETTATGESASTMSAVRHGSMSRSPAERAAIAEKVILTRVRRNYIYFSSLLQEPEAKWKPNTDARGVTIKQLDSIDPTLVVYRAEAVFVGVGMWDLYAAITSPGTRAFWDKTHEDAQLLSEVNELTELWYLKTKAAWPVNARDCVLLKTVYKSPTTLHVFAFSTDDNQLFSNIPSADPTTIRMQVDLQGWAIESLSPTTTALTLLEQSDPKGWSNKSSIPQQMIATVAGVGEFAIKSGGPPVLSRLGGAKKTAMKYDHEKGTFRVEYERKEPPAQALTLSNTPPSASTSSLVSQQATPPQMQYIECEIRCDLDTWASAVDVVVDPPPQRVSCLRRHRLSGGGGGLWLTIEHDALFAGDERLMVIIRKAGKDAKSSVVVNGSKVKVDVEELPEAEVKSLAKQKRVKPTRIPLDQPPVLGAIKRRREEWADSATNSRPDSPAPPAAPGPGSTPASPAAPRFVSPLTRFFTMAVEQATGAATAPQGADSPLSSEVHPMKYAVDKLAWLRRHHAKGPEHVNQPGPWTALAEKAFSIHRAMDANVSNTIPVHRAEKVFQGVSADEIASALTNYDCRKQWDTRFDSALVLEEYGSGCHTAFLVSRGGYMFRDRGFYLASATARLADRRSGSLSLSRHNSSNSIGTPTSHGQVIFHVSTSFAPESAARFAASKYNPHALPIGRLLVEGWILETLDPYASEEYPIPSTRCTHLVAIDFAGAVPVAVNAMMNSQLPRAILALEAFVLKMRQPPVLRLPPLGVSVTRIADEEGDVWAVERKDKARTSIAARFFAHGESLRATMLLRRRPRLVDDTPRPSTLSPPMGHHSREDNASTATVRRRTISATSAGGSVDAALIGLANPDDTLVAEFVVDLRMYKEGYAVEVVSALCAEGEDEPIALGRLAGAKIDTLPITCHAFTLPASAVTTDRKTGARHLLRFTLRTAPYDAPPVDDPLTGEQYTPPPTPQWLTDLEARGAVVEICVKPRSASGKSATSEVLVNDAIVQVVGEKDSLSLLGRRELEEDRLCNLAVLSRVAIKDGMSEQTVHGLTAPIAIAKDLLPDPAPESDFSTPASMQSSVTGDALKADPAAGVTVETVVAEPRPLMPRSASVLNNLFNNYSAWLGSAGLVKGATPATGADNEAPARTGSPEPIEPNAAPAVSDGQAAAVAADEASGTRPRLMKRLEARKVSLWTLITVALLSFLLGSLLRSLVVPADFVYLPPETKGGSGAGDVQSQWSELQRLVELNHHERWREMKRLIEFRGPFGRWDVVLAVIRRG